MRRNVLMPLCEMTGLPAIIRGLRAIPKFFEREQSLSEQIEHAFPKSSQAYATAFFEEYFARKNLADWIFQYHIRDAEDFYRTAIFYLRGPIQTAEPGIWLIAEDSIRYMWQILYDTNSHAVIFDGDTKFEIASSLTDFVKRLAALGVHFQTDQSVSNDTKSLLQQVFTEDELVTAMKIFLMADTELCNIDLLVSKCLPLDDVELTMDNYRYRGRFLFEPPFYMVSEVWLPGWWMIGHGVDDEDTGPDEGFIIVHHETGKLAWLRTLEHDEKDELCEGFDYFTIANHLEEWIGIFKK